MTNENTAPETLVLGDDLPKTNPWQDDRLGYTPFCERLVKVILSFDAPSGYVIGLHGEWGSGKSRALNFVRAFLEKHNQECTDEKDAMTLIDFQPWIVSGHQDLIAAFFRVLTETLGDQLTWLERQRNRFFRAFRLGGDSLIDAAATVAVTVDPSGGLASKTVGTVAKKSIGAMVDKFLADPSLQSAYDDLRVQLADSGRRFLVTIDDIDRLQSDEIRSIMQMVKTVGRLPNVIYLLAYDRNIVWPALDGDSLRNGPRFAEKIIQQEVELPVPSKEALLSILDEDIAFLNQHIDESLRWHYIVRDGVRRWIRHPRDLLRLANAVKFSWPALQGEVDPGDLLAMEGLRLFDNTAFRWIRENRDFLFSEGAFILARDETDAATVERLKQRLTAEVRESVINLLVALFPGSTKTFRGDKAMSEESSGSIVSRRGVGCPQGYDAYFSLHPSADAIPKSVIDGLVANLSDGDALREAILPYLEKRDRRGQPVIGQLLEELRYRFEGEGRAHPTQAVLNFLFDIGEDVLSAEWRVEAFAVSPRAKLSVLIQSMLDTWGAENAGKHLIESFKMSTSAAFCAEVFVDRARELGKIAGGNSVAPKILEEDLVLLGQELLEKIRRSAHEGTLENAPFYFNIVRAWSYLADPGEARAWLSSGMIKSPTFLAKIGRAHV